MNKILSEETRNPIIPPSPPPFSVFSISRSLTRSVSPTFQSLSSICNVAEKLKDNFSQGKEADRDLSSKLSRKVDKLKLKFPFHHKKLMMNIYAKTRGLLPVEEFSLSFSDLRQEAEEESLRSNNLLEEIFSRKVDEFLDTHDLDLLQAESRFSVLLERNLGELALLIVSSTKECLDELPSTSLFSRHSPIHPI